MTEYQCPVCGEVWSHQALVHEAQRAVLPVIVIWDDFEARGCQALGMPHFGSLGYPA